MGSKRTRTALLAVIALAATVLIGQSAVASGSTEDGDDNRTLTLYTTTVNDVFVDADNSGGGGPSPGDLAVFRDAVYSDADRTDQIGYLIGQCMFTFEFFGNCQVSVYLDGGDSQLVVNGAIDFSTFPEPFVLPVTGGSGAYHDSGGEVEVTISGAQEQFSTLVFSLDD